MIAIRKISTAALLAAGLLTALVPTAGPAHADGVLCRSPYPLKVGNVSWTLQPCVQWAYNYSAATGQWGTYVWGWTDATNGSTDVYVHAEVGSQYCVNSSCNSVSWMSDTFNSFHVWPAGYAQRVYIAHTVPVSTGSFPGASYCYRVRSSLTESSIGTVGDIESPPACF